jgi:hypothetical protein
VDATNLRSEVPIGARVRREQNGEPQMGGLLDATLDYTASGSEVQPPVPPRPSPGLGTTAKHTGRGWVDGHFRETGSFVNNPNLATWATPSERFNYYHGHRAGREARRRRSGGLPQARERSSGRTRA